MKTSYVVTALLAAASIYVFFNYAPNEGWGSLLRPCKHCACPHKRAPRHVTEQPECQTAVEESNCQTSSCPAKE